ncbi:hypothetical protein C2R22_24215 (plasmid) [Salinigranum rubrum]|uniref:Uncharacterized protein n=1 Tax=Salinigranum rubrum TaxID=755307 RepID=A0A2I8VRT7_9EURY|nr:hypothetical protein [Salinigranum rubrum]AUV84638.1 hypothetical protein C2R22_24215 [Salinigranum rubrum]
MRDTDSSPRSASPPPGYHEDDPYEGEDFSTYPARWRNYIEEFPDHGLRPYRPTRFSDGAYVPVVIDSLEAELGVDIRVRSTRKTGVSGSFSSTGNQSSLQYIGVKSRDTPRYMVSSYTLWKAVHESL